jgi:hypothetical protein
VEIVDSNRGINETNNAADRYAFVSEEAYHIRLSSITRDDICGSYTPNRLSENTINKLSRLCQFM